MHGLDIFTFSTGFYAGGVVGLFLGVIITALIYRRNRQHGDALVDKAKSVVKKTVKGKASDKG